MTFPKRTTLLYAGLSLLLTRPAAADPAEAGASDAADKVDTIVVTGEAAALADGPFGPGRTALETPRSVTSISEQTMRDLGIADMRDIMKVTPNAYSPTDFGTPSLPHLRGQLGEIFTDGLRQQGGNNGFGVPISFNAVDSLDVTKGPPTAVLGSTQRVGGFISLNLKRPDLTQARGAAELGSGTWNRQRGQVDYSQPIVPGRSAVRVSIEHLDQGSYYDYAHHDSDNVYVAYRLKPDDASVLDASLEYYDVEFTDNAGINRPTQDLIDHGTYITGQGVQPNGSTIPGAFSVISPTGEVRLPRHRVLTDPDDKNSVDTWIAHLRYDRALGPGLHYLGRTYYQHLERSEVANNSFVEIVDGADTAEHRSELIFDQGPGLWGMAQHQQTDVGIDVRYNRVLGYSQFTTEADMPVDLTGPLSNRRIPLTPEQQAGLVRLRDGVYVSPGAQYPRDGQDAGYMLSDTTHSHSYQIGALLQHEVEFTSRWSAIAGLRGDQYFVKAQDPLPPPGQEAAKDRLQRFLKAGNFSLNYKPTESVAWYTAWSYSESTSNSMAGGTVLGAGNRISPANFDTRSRFYEGGVKWAPADASWQTDLSVFSQTRSLRNRDGSNSGIRTRGAEAQWQYREDRVFAAATLGLLEARYDHSASFQDSAQVSDAFDDSRPDIVVGTGVGAPNFAFFPASTRRVQGVPSTTASALVGYEFLSGFAATLSGRYNDSFRLDYLNTVRIRSQYTLDASVGYRYKPTGTELRLLLNNITDEKNWAPVFDGGYFGSTDVFPELPFNVLVSLRQSFDF